MSLYEGLLSAYCILVHDLLTLSQIGIGLGIFVAQGVFQFYIERLKKRHGTIYTRDRDKQGTQAEICSIHPHINIIKNR